MADGPACGTCAHWLAIPVGNYDLVPRSIDHHPYTYEGDDDEPGRPADGAWGYCGRVAEFWPAPAGRFYVIDGSEYMAKLGTRSDFGCVEHEGKTDR